MISLAVSCQSSGSTRQPAAGGEYEVVNHAEIQRRDSLLAEKYAKKLEVPHKEISNSISLYKFIDKNLDTPCSKKPGKNTTTDVQFTQQLYRIVYGRKIPGTYKALKHSKLLPKFSSRKYLAEGDLLFFEQSSPKSDNSDTNQLPKSPEKVIGIYLKNSEFVTCSEKDGALSIDNLQLPYWNDRYKMAGRMR